MDKSALCLLKSVFSSTRGADFFPKIKSSSGLRGRKEKETGRKGGRQGRERRGEEEVVPS